MGPEDEGTPPCQERLLANECSSPAYHAERHVDEGWEAEYEQPVETAKRSGWKSYLPMASSTKRTATENGVDLVKLLNENWFWRSSTASPSMAETSTSSRHDSASSYSRYNPHRQQTRATVSAASSGQANAAAGGNPFAGQAQAGGPAAAQNPLRDERTQAHSPASRGDTSTLERRSQSANIDNLEPSREGSVSQPRAHSYAQGALFKGRRKNRLEEVTEGDPLGTWAHRVVRYQPHHTPTAPTHIPGTPDVDDLHPRQQSTAKGQPPSEQGEDAAIEAAWRWRFNRRWRTEQAKQLDPDFGMDGEDEDGWDEALGYLDACGPGFHLQIARTASADKNLVSSSVVSNGSDLSNLLIDDSQKEKVCTMTDPEKSALEQADMDATKSIVSVAKKAQDLYRQQQKIERDVQTRWGNTMVSMSWAGQYLRAVQIDSYGQFPFILVKVSDRTSAHRLLVRGKNNASTAELYQAVTQEVKVACKQHKLATISVALLGSGVMEWSRERDRRINVASGHVEKGCDPSIQTSDDVVRLAGALTRASLPAPNRVTVNGKKLS